MHNTTVTLCGTLGHVIRSLQYHHFNVVFCQFAGNSGTNTAGTNDRYIVLTLPKFALSTAITGWVFNVTIPPARAPSHLLE